MVAVTRKVAALLAVLVVTACSFVAAEDGVSTGSETFEFQAEVSRLMDIIVHSLYSNRDIFLRELVSNANDAIDKIRFQSLTNASVLDSGEELAIRISVDEDEQTITIVDTGIGMTKSDLIKNLGTIAKSGTSSFLEKLSDDTSAGGGKTANLIGQFGVGFYSSFLVADTVTVISKHNDDRQWRWTSQAGSGFTIREDNSEPLGRGTKIILQMRSDAEPFLNNDAVKRLVRRYSAFIVFPIYLKEVTYEEMDESVPDESSGEGDTLDMDAEEIKIDTTTTTEEGVEKVERIEKVEGIEKDDEAIDVAIDVKETLDADEDNDDLPPPKEIIEWKLVNDMKPLWTRDPSDITREEYVAFYKSISKTDEEPLTYTHFKAEGDVEFRGLLFIPKEPLMPLANTQDVVERHLVKLYVKRVLVTETVENGLLPSWLSFIVGIVDSDDLPINISRETLQESKTMQAIKKKLLRKALEALKSLMDEPEPKEKKEKDGDEDGGGEKTEEKAVHPYLDFWKVYGPTVKMGMIMDLNNRDRISKLVRLKTSKTDMNDPTDLVTFDEYMDRMKPGQEYIYTHSGETLETVASSPFLEQLLDLDYEVVYLTDAVDEYLVQYYQDHQGTKLMSVAKDNFRLGSEDDDIIRAKAKRGKKRIKSLLSFLKKTLGSDKVSSVRTSMKLTRSACALSTEQFGYTARMETVIRAQALSSPDKVNSIPKQKVMEVNPYHPVILGLSDLVAADKDSQRAIDLANAMYDTALISSGYYLHDHTEHGIRIARIMAERVGLDPNATFEEPELPPEDEGDAEAFPEDADDAGDVIDAVLPDDDGDANDAADPHAGA